MPAATYLVAALVVGGGAPASTTPASPGGTPTWFVIGESGNAILAVDQASLSRSGDLAQIVEAQVFRTAIDTDYGVTRRINVQLSIDCGKHLVSHGSLTLFGVDGDVLRKAAEPTSPGSTPTSSPLQDAEAFACRGAVKPETGPYRLQTIINVAAGSAPGG